MNLKKSKTSIRKLFVALCVLGSGIHVHGVEKTTSVQSVKTSVIPANMNIKFDTTSHMFFDAARNGDVSRMSELLNTLLSIDGRDEAGKSRFMDWALAEAAANGQQKVMRMIVDWKNDHPKIYCSNDHRKVTKWGLGQAFRVAARYGHQDIMQWLLNEVLTNSEVIQEAVNGAFTSATKGGHQEIMQWLLKEVSEDIRVPQRTVDHALKSAVFSNEPERVMKWLLNEVPVDRKLTQQVVNKVFEDVAEHIMGMDAEKSKPEEFMEWLLKEVTDERRVTKQTVQDAFVAAAYWGNSAILKYLIKQNHIQLEQKTLKKGFYNLVSNMSLMKGLKDLKNFAEVHFPKEMYEDSVLSKKLDQFRKELAVPLDWNPVCRGEWKEFMAIITKGNRNSPFAEYLLDSFIKGKEWISKDGVNTLMLNQYYQDTMALMKLRKQGATKVSKLPGGVFRHMLEYVEPSTTQPSITNMGVHGNREASEEEDETEGYTGGKFFRTRSGRIGIRRPPE